MPFTRRDPDRLTFDDTLFETMRRALGTPVVSQTVWRFPTRLDVDGLRRFHAHLAEGPLNRVLCRSRVPAARDRWVAGSVAGSGTAPLAVGVEVQDQDVTAWIEAHAADTALDPEHGPTWALAYTPTSGGGSALSFVTSHVVADGSLKLLSLEAAARGETLPRLPSGSDAAPVAGVPADVADAVRQVAGAARALPGLLRGGRPGGTPQEPVPARPDDELPWTPPVVIVDVPLAAWERCAAAAGGTPNALLLAICAELAVGTGRVETPGTVRVASPVSTRTAGDLRSNASTGVSVEVPIDEDGRVASLADVRAHARAAYAGLTAGEGAAARSGDPLAAARALLPLLPDPLIRRLAPSWPAPLVLASNLGALSADLVAPTGVPATSVLNRSITPPTPRGAARRTRAGLSAWWGAAGPTATLCVAGADPDAFPSAAGLRGQVATVLARRGLTPTPW